MPNPPLYFIIFQEWLYTPAFIINSKAFYLCSGTSLLCATNLQVQVGELAAVPLPGLSRVT